MKLVILPNIDSFTLTFEPEMPENQSKDVFVHN